MNTNRKKLSNYLTLYLASIFYVILFFYFFAGYAGPNALNITNTNKVFIITAFPQGWCFFTRSPEEKSTYLYDITNNKPSLHDLRGFNPEFSWGFSRKNRLLTMEIGNILSSHVNADSVISYKKKCYASNKLTDMLSVDTLKYNRITLKNILILKGKYILEMDDFIPWSLRRRLSLNDIKTTKIFIPVIINQ
ncbi:MAG: SdpA family antimicrobial peptide system protein [Flavipsychrobacter sp.]|nr:SdpA family antimicrobial peptide system protein [Flavipsychrobacter sp.]